MIKDHVDVVNQAVQLLTNITDEHYTDVNSVLFEASIGQHIRHITDHYLALLSSERSQSVNYNTRHRESPVASEVDAALNVLQRIRQWLLTLSDAQLDAPLTVISEVSLSDQSDEHVYSSLGRELMFVSSHAIHHFSMIAIMRRYQGVDVADGLGVAPATLSHVRRAAG
ncbi:DinB family protein [Aestuariibacter salexigens]|uniref:DinB family protein n=1 Tax=Aestuariibacter salexigens TaxID=226010 RepID=UPI00041EC03E|nr:DinB family protein [Aestuariibacter salexigens]